MAEFPVLTVETAGESGSLLEKNGKAYGFVPNLHVVMAKSATMLEAYQTLSDLFTRRTGLSSTEQQIIAMTNNRLNGCTHCERSPRKSIPAAAGPVRTTSSRCWPPVTPGRRFSK